MNNPPNTVDKNGNQRHAQKVTYFSIGGNLLLFVLKLWAGLVSSSVSLLADALHTLSDAISSLIVLIALRYSKKPADEEHPFGHGRAELIASIMIGTLLLVVAFHFCFESVNRLSIKKPANYGSIAVVATVLSIILKELMAQFSFRIGKREKSSSLLADAWHHRSDSLSSLVILLGIFLGNKFWWIDGVLGILVSVFIAYIAYTILKEAASSLLGQEVDDKMLNTIISTCNQMAGFNTQVHQVHLHQYGDHLDLVFHIVLPGYWPLKKVHELVDSMELKLDEELNTRTTIHVDPDKIIH